MAVSKVEAVSTVCAADDIYVCNDRLMSEDATCTLWTAERYKCILFLYED